MKLKNTGICRAVLCKKQNLKLKVSAASACKSVPCCLFCFTFLSSLFLLLTYFCKVSPRSNASTNNQGFWGKCEYDCWY